MKVKVRASSWGKLFDCAMSWEGTHILGMHMPSSMRAQLGTAIHAGTAVYDLSRMNHAGLSVMECAEAVVDTLRHPEREVDYRRSDMTIDQAEAIGLDLYAKYCQQISPRYEFRAIELEVKPLEIDCGNGVTIVLTGTLDRARAIAAEYGLRLGDLKSGRNAVTQDKQTRKITAKTKGHGPQIATYQILLEHTLNEPVQDTAEIIGLGTGSTQEVAIGTMAGAREMLLGAGEEKGLIHYAAEMFKSGMFPPNPQSWLCSPRYCARWATCRFHG